MRHGPRTTAQQHPEGNTGVQVSRTSSWLSRDFFTCQSPCQLLALHSIGLSKVCSALKSQDWKELPLDAVSYVT